MDRVLVFDNLLSTTDVEAVIDVWHRYPAYTPIGQGFYLRSNDAPKLATTVNPGTFPKHKRIPLRHRFAPGLEFRADANRNYLRTGGHLGRTTDPLLGARHRYFRETYVYGATIFMTGIEPLLYHETLLAAAQSLHGRPVIVPAIVYANLMLPGQELGLHHDIPEFRGANIGQLPGWLLVVMHFSGCFAAWRVPLVTAVMYVGEGGRGGEFVCYANGTGAAATSVAARFNRGIMLETDSILHGVDRIAGGNPAIRHITRGTQLVHDGDHRWSLRSPTPSGTRRVARFTSDDIRCSVSWKAYGFADDAERRAWVDGSDDLTLDIVIDRLVEELCARGRRMGPDHGLSEEELGLLLIDEFVPFPATARA